MDIFTVILISLSTVFKIEVCLEFTAYWKKNPLYKH